MKKLFVFVVVCLLTSCASSTGTAGQICVIEDCDISAVHSHTTYWATY